MLECLYSNLKEVIILKTITLRLDDEVHKTIKIKTVQEETTIQDYITKLIMKDLELNKNKKM